MPQYKQEPKNGTRAKKKDEGYARRRGRHVRRMPGSLQPKETTLHSAFYSSAISEPGEKLQTYTGTGDAVVSSGLTSEIYGVEELSRKNGRLCEFESAGR